MTMSIEERDRRYSDIFQCHGVRPITKEEGK